MKDLWSKLQANAQERPDAVALRKPGLNGCESTTYAELAADASRFAAIFQRYPSATIVPIFLPKTSQCVAAMFGALGAGKAFACLNRKLRPPQLVHILEDMRPAVGVTDPSGATVLRDLREAMSADWYPASGEEILIPATFRDALLEREFISPGCCLFTSGSTGAPKGVCVAAADLTERARAEIQLFGLAATDVLLNILPLSFDVGLNQLMTAIASGCELVLLDSWLPADVLKATATFGVTGISAVPAVWLDMIRGRAPFDTSAAHRRLRYITLSGGDLPASQLQEIPPLAPGVQIFKTYGQTETFRSTALLPHEFESRRTSVGRPFAGARVYVVRPDGASCDPMEEGEIVHTGLGVMFGYLDGQDPQNKLRANPFQDASGHAVFTGDRGYFDSDGYLFLRGRSDGMVKIAGNRVYPEEVAIQLVEAGALEAQVLPVAAPDGQTRLIAFVVAGTDLTPGLSKRLPAYMVPWKIHNVAAIPRTANGKPDRPRLLALAMGTELTVSLS